MSKSERPTRAVLYLRISQDHTGEGLAVEWQREDCEQIAEQRGWQIVALYDDTQSASDRNKKRPNYDRRVADYRAGAFEAIICWDLDRSHSNRGNSRTGSRPPKSAGCDSSQRTVRPTSQPTEAVYTLE